MREVVAFTDGACRGNPGPGGWGVVLRWGEQEKHLHGGEPGTTNNRMELTAAIEALAALKQPCRVRLYTDSKYLRDGITIWLPNWVRRGWQTAGRKPVKNQDLWLKLKALSDRHQVDWHWVKGHGGHPDNDLADLLANRGLEEAL